MNEMHEELKARIETAFRNGADGYGGVSGGAQAVIETLELSAKKFRDKDGTFVIVSGKWDA